MTHNSVISAYMELEGRTQIYKRTNVWDFYVYISSYNKCMKLDQNGYGAISYRLEIARDQKVVFAFLSKGTCHRPLTMQVSVVLCK